MLSASPVITVISNDFCPIFTQHPKTMFSSRLVKFSDSLCTSSKKEVYLLGNLAISDNRTVLGKTMSRLKREMECQELSSGLVREKMKYFPTPEGETWRLEFL